MPELKYIGQGACLPGIPARDLTAEEAELYRIDVLVASGLYERVLEPEPQEEMEIVEWIELPKPSQRTLRALEGSGISLDEALGMTWEELLAIEGIGPASASEILDLRVE